MQLTVWTYEGPPHIGAMRIATAMKGVHYVLHAPQGDTYADLLFTMIERRDKRPPVTYTTFQARDLGGDTAELFKTAAREAYERFQPEALLVGSSCTAELIQDDPGGLAAALNLPVPVIPLELPAYQKKENWGAAETFYRVVRTCTAAWKGRRQAEAGAPGLQSSRPDRARLPASRRRGGNHEAAGESRRRHERHRPSWRVSGGHRAPSRRRFQCRALPRDRDDGGAISGARLQAAFHEDRAHRDHRD